MFTTENHWGVARCYAFAPRAGVKELPGFVHVVDDDASFRKAIERQLKQAGYEALMFTRTDSSSLRGGCLLDLDVEPSQIL